MRLDVVGVQFKRQRTAVRYGAADHTTVVDLDLSGCGEGLPHPTPVNARTLAGRRIRN
jgi:hypothetical protein